MNKINRITFVVLAASAFICGCAKKEQKSGLIPPTPALMTQAVSENVHEYISTLGTTAAMDSANIVAQVTGMIVKINFRQGEQVKAGQVLAEIDPRPYEAAVMQAEGNLKQALAQLKIDELEVERNRKLVKNNYVDKQTFDSYVAKVESDKGAVQALKGVLDNANLNLEWCKIKAPIDGKVGLYNINVGNVVAANSSVITTIERVDRLFVDFVVPSQRLYDVLTLMNARGGKLGIRVSYIEDDFAQKRFRDAEVGVVLNKIRYETGTAVLRGELENKDFLFWPDQPVKVSVNMERMEGAVLVPDGAVQMNQEGEYVYLATPNKAGVYVLRQAKVQTGQLYPGNMRLVKSGVKAGDLVVLRVSQLLLQAGPFVYRANEKGMIIGQDGKPITDPAAMKAFMKNAAEVAGGLRAEYMKSRMQAAAGATKAQAAVKEAVQSVNAQPGQSK